MDGFTSSEHSSRIFRRQNKWRRKRDSNFYTARRISKLLIPHSVKQVKTGKKAGSRHNLGTRPERVPSISMVVRIERSRNSVCGPKNKIEVNNG
jgi:hypothetical protein